MTKIITPAFTVPEIEQAIIANETVTFAPGRYFLDRPICLSNLSGRTLLGDNAVLSGAQEEKVTWNEMGNSIYCAQIGTQRKIDGLRIGNTTFIQARYPHATDKDAIWQGSAADALDFAARCAHPETGYFHVMHPGLGEACTTALQVAMQTARSPLKAAGRTIASWDCTTNIVL